MKSLKRYYLFFILPAVVLVFSFVFRSISGPFWQYADPCYFYLFNALYIVKGLAPANVWHPGTPLQVLIFFVIRAFNMGHTAAEAVDQVLLNPEFYLNAVHIVLVLGSFATSVILGTYIYRKTKDVLAAILVQLPGLSFLTWPSINAAYPVLPIVANVSPEPMFMTVINLFNLAFLRLYFSKDQNNKLSPVLWLGFICGLGLAVKLGCFFPAVFSALIVVTFRRKWQFILSVLVSFVFWTLPIISKYPMVWGQVKQAVLYSGRYGWGTATVIDWGSYFLYSKDMIHEYWFFIFLAIGLLIGSLLSLLKDKTDREAVFLAAAASGSLLLFLVIPKYFSFHYLVPGIGLFSASFLLAYLTIKKKSQGIKPLAVIFILVYLIKSVMLVFPYYHRLSGLTDDIRSIEDRLSSEYPNCSILPTWTGDINIYLSKEQAMSVANAISFYNESDALTALYPHFHYFFSEEFNSDTVGYGIWDFKRRIFADDLVQISPCNIFLKYGSDFSNYPYQTKLIDHSKILSAYLLAGSSEKEASALFLYAQKAYKDHDLKTAFALGLKSYQLNYEPRGEIRYFLSVLYGQLQGK